MKIARQSKFAWQVEPSIGIVAVAFIKENKARDIDELLLERAQSNWTERKIALSKASKTLELCR